MQDTIQLSHGGGGKQTQDLAGFFREILGKSHGWTNSLDDGAVMDIGDRKLVFTTDSYTVDPIFFPGGDIGKLSVCGTLNDLSVMGADPVGLSLSLVLEEGFSMKDLEQIMYSIKNITEYINVPVVTGDTKVMEKGKLDKVIINTSGIGFAQNTIPQKSVQVGDKVFVSGTLGDHAVALLSKRFDYETSVISDCAPIYREIKQVRDFLTAAKDPTRGGLSGALHEISVYNSVCIILNEESVPFRKEAHSVCNLLGLDPYQLACEGRFIGCVSEQNADTLINKLKQFNPDASLIGEVVDGSGVYIDTMVGRKHLEVPSGRLVPRIC